MFVEVVRMFTVVLGTAAGFWLSRDLGGDPASHQAAIGGILGCLVGYVGGGILGRLVERAVGAVEERVERFPPARVVAGTLGALGGGACGFFLAVPALVGLPARVALPVVGLLTWIGAWTGLRVIGAKSVAVLEMMGLSTRPLVRARAYDARDGFLVDTSVLMDGTLLPLARTGILGSDLLVTRFVLDELQGFVDARDDTKSRRAHRGLEMLEALRGEGGVRLFVLDDEVPEIEAVDAKLVALARRLQLRILTNDSALARVAEVQGVPTCNLRRLASDLAPAIVPGDLVRVSLTRRGREEGQGVGHLDDGSMVVVNGGEDLVGGPELSLQVTSVVPTSVGRIVFATVDDGSAVEADSSGSRRGAASVP